jgi:CheY-like chemotaxis protein
VVAATPAAGQGAPPRLHAADGDDELEGPAPGEVIGVVDDDPDVRATVCELLHRSGYRTVSAATADEALETLVRHRPRLVLMDLALSCPEAAVLRTGVDVAISLAEKLGRACPAVIFMTGAITVAARLLADLPEVLHVDVLGKPVDLDVLRAKVEGALGAGRGASRA